jgi:hypothetical protein
VREGPRPDAVTARAAPRGPNTGAGSTGVGGTVVIATGADAETLFPPLAQGLTARQVVDLVFEPLAELGADLNTVGDAGFRPRLARAWRWAPTRSPSRSRSTRGRAGTTARR